MTATATPVVAGSIGVFGGTFDPIHFAHLAVAQEAAEVLGLECILFIPAGHPPHKLDRAISPAADRLAMVELAIAGNPRFAIDQQELDRPGPSYTVDTLDALHGKRSAEGAVPDLSLILSSEAYLGLPGWREPDRILALARLVIAPRDGYPAADSDSLQPPIPGSDGRVTFLDGPRMRLSASELRGRAASGRSVRYLVPDTVAAYIDEHGLYLTSRRTTET